MNKNIIDRMAKLKTFIMRIFQQAITEGNNLKDGEYIRVLATKEDVSYPNFFKNIDALIDYCISSKMNYTNLFFNIATTNGIDGTLESIQNHYFLVFDFDKKKYKDGFNHKDVLNLFRDINLKYHALVDSGHGYHAYVMIEKTNDINKVNDIMVALAKRLRSDEDAAKKTQIIRVPQSYNCKEIQNRKLARIIFLEEQDKIKRYTIDYLYNKYCSSNKKREDINLEYLQKNTNIKPCVNLILQNGSKEGCNNKDLQKIVVDLRYRNKTLKHIKELTKEWNLKNQVMWPNSELEYQVEYMYKNLYYTEYNCQECDLKKECKGYMKSDFKYEEGTNKIEMTEKDMKYLKHSKRKGVKEMDGNELVIYTILKNHSDGLVREEIIKEITYKNNCCLSKNTLTKTLKNLEENNFIEVIKKERGILLYKLKPNKCKEELKYIVSFAATYEAIKGNITTEELRLYNYMRYIQHKEQRENPEALKGNLLQITQTDLGNGFGVSQQRISQMIENLMQEKIISPYYRGKSKNNGFDFYIYRLNY